MVPIPDITAGMGGQVHGTSVPVSVQVIHTQFRDSNRLALWRVCDSVCVLAASSSNEHERETGTRGGVGSPDGGHHHRLHSSGLLLCPLHYRRHDRHVRVQAVARYQGPHLWLCASSEARGRLINVHASSTVGGKFARMTGASGLCYARDGRIFNVDCLLVDTGV